MKTRTLKELLLYNYRYWIGYSIVIGFIIYFLGWRLGSLLPGISMNEISTAASNTSLKEILSSPINPLHSLLQWASITLLDVSALSIRLPSALLGLLSAFFLYQLLKKWFGKPTALISTALFVSADWFLFIARSATGAIEFNFWLSLAILSFTKLLERNNKWILLYATSLAGLLYTPFGVYAVVTLLIGLFTSRVFRERAKEASLKLKIPSAAIMFIATALLVFFSIKDISFIKTLLGVDNLPTILEYGRNAFFNASAVIAVLPTANQTVSPTGILFVRFFELIFICFGIMMLWRTRVNRLNLTILLLAVVLAAAGGLGSASLGGSLLLVPAAIFMTAGIRHFIFRWQRTFPKNPYARTAALIPLTALFITAVALHYTVYFTLWPNQTATARVFTKDFSLAQQELQKNSYKSKVCYIDSTNSQLNALLAASNLACTPTFASNEIKTELPAVSLLKPESKTLVDPTILPIRPLVSESMEDNIRWLVVIPSQQ